MKLSATYGFLLLLTSLFTTAYAQEAQYPIVPEFGGIYEIPGSVQPDSDLDYKIVIDLKTLQSEKGQLNLGLNNVARMMNLHGLGGVSKENLQVVVAVHGGATETILTNERYRQKNGTDNPNLELISALKNSGAELYVCGQSLLARGYELDEVNPEIEIGLSMLTIVTEHMHKGYQLLVFD